MNIIRSIRLRYELTQKECAPFIEVSRSSWSRYERSKKRPKALTLSMLKAIESAAVEVYGGVQSDLEELIARAA